MTKRDAIHISKNNNESKTMGSMSLRDK